MLTDKFDNLTFEQRGEGVVLLTINREAGNTSLDAATLRELLKAFETINNNDGIRTAILIGADYSVADIIAREDYRLLDDGLRCQRDNWNKPVIAGINGLVSDLGLFLALTCPLRIATSDTKFQMPRASESFYYFECGDRLPPFDDPEFEIYTTRYLSARQALEIGLINRVVETYADLLPACEEMAAKICANAPLAIKYALASVNRGSHLTPDDAMFLETALFSLCFATEDMREGTRAFLEKRAPEFRGK
ncbi:MAG TPA: enoyl-CoA hydratase-related protein [Blastocatellia bacterium]|nr:enoyl-CoA hydratase-related protein [Blastocatellia bacterium]